MLRRFTHNLAQSRRLNTRSHVAQIEDDKSQLKTHALAYDTNKTGENFKAMAFSQRTPTFRPQLSVRRVYETLQPRSEAKELPEAYLLHIYLPGFPRDSVKITYEASSRTVRISGERQIQGTRWHRIDQSYPIPDYCEAEALQGKYDAPVLTLTMPKKSTTKSQAAPKQVGTSQDNGVEAESKPGEKVQDVTPPQPTTTTKVEEPIEDKKSASPTSPDFKAQKKEDTPSQTPSKPIRNQTGQEEAVERVGPTAEPQTGEKELEQKPPREATMQRDEKTQKDQEGVVPKSTPAVPTIMETDEKPQKGQEEFGRRPTTMLTKVKTAEKDQKGQEEFEPRPTPAMLTKVKTAEKSQQGQEETEPKSTPTTEPKIITDEQPPKGQAEGESNPAITNVTRKPTIKGQLEEKRTEETSAEDAKKERTSKKEAKEEPYESRKPAKDKEQADFEEKEAETEKFIANEAETSAAKVQKKREKKSSSRTSHKKAGKSEENAVEGVGCVSQVFSKVGEGILNEEEKKLAANIGAAVLIIAALGYYISYRFTS
ncbi:unnamed protein product [Sphenostylis stenocarpa]|uniref:SHSP domain-containing protein n=1 Tax=Sphenostylis stenocarpa TaxID=92480 RepID=A0AA86VDI6_9FABA|nr:unnamed protein product [Sphenostylis stenocarpa]